MKLKANRKRATDDVIADLRAQVKKEEPAVDADFPLILQDMIGDLTGEPEPVVIKLFSEDPKLLEEQAPRVADAIEKDRRRSGLEERH